MPSSTHPNLVTTDRGREFAMRLADRAKTIREGKIQWREKALRHWRIWEAKRDSSAGYNGRLQLYLPVGRRVLENWVLKLYGDMFPKSGRWFQVKTDGMTQEKLVPPVQAYFDKCIKEYMHVRRRMVPWLRTLVTVGTAAREIGWKVEELPIPVLRHLRDKEGNLTDQIAEEIQKVVHYLGPTWRTVSPFQLHVWPFTAMDTGEAEMVFEDVLVERDRIALLGRTPIDPADPSAGRTFENVEEALSLLASSGGSTVSSETEERFAQEQQRLRARGFLTRVDTDRRLPVHVLDVAKYMIKTAPLSDDDAELSGGAPLWYKVAIAGDTIPLQVQRSPWWFMGPSIDASKFVEVEGEFWGYGLPEVFEGLQYWTNDVMNQAGDALTWSMNPIIAVDPAAVQDPNSIRMRPGAKWLVRNPTSSIFPLEPPKETPALGLATMAQLIALINDVSNVAPFSGVGASGPRQRGRALNTAEGMQIVLSESLVQVSAVLEHVEDTVLNPTLQKMWAVTQQCYDREVFLETQGPAAAQLTRYLFTRKDLVGDFRFQWLGSTSSFNMQVKAQQMLQFLQIIGRFPPEYWQAQGVQLDVVHVIRTLWVEGYGSADGDRVIRPIDQTISIDPYVENALFHAGRGEEVRVSPADQDEKHLQIHDHAVQDPELSAAGHESLLLHIRRHFASMLAKQQMQQQQGMMQAIQQMLPGGGGGMAGGMGAGRTPPQGGGAAQSSGAPGMPQAPGRMATTASMGDVMRQQPRGLT